MHAGARTRVSTRIAKAEQDLVCPGCNLSESGDMSDVYICHNLRERLRMKGTHSCGAEEKEKQLRNPSKAKGRGGLCRL